MSTPRELHDPSDGGETLRDVLRQHLPLRDDEFPDEREHGTVSDLWIRDVEKRDGELYPAATSPTQAAETTSPEKVEPE